MESAIVCPVCTLFLRPGITLEAHLELHPKDKVIEALIRLHSMPHKHVLPPPAAPANPPPVPPQPNMIFCYAAEEPANSTNSFFYQQIVSSSSQQSQFVSMPGFPQPNVVYQQQRVIVASSPTSRANLRRLMPKPSSADIVELDDDGVKARPKQLSEPASKSEHVEDASEDEEPPISLKIDVGDPTVQELPNTACSTGEYPSLEAQKAGRRAFEFEDVADASNAHPAVSSAFATFKDERPVDMLAFCELSGDGHVSIDSARIRADEHMPARGELSGQESNASGVSWTRAIEGSSRMSASYDLIARERWDESESESEASYHCLPAFPNADVVISGSSRQGIEYKCDACDERFTCPKARREHQQRAHVEVATVTSASPAAAATTTTTTTSSSSSSSSAPNIIGSRLFGSKVKKLVIKRTSQTQNGFIKTEMSDEPVHSFEPIFSIKKLEEESGVDAPPPPPPPASTQMDVKAVPVVPILCVQCCSIVRDVATLRDHQVLHHGYLPEMKYRCGVCHEAFFTEPKYTEHLAIHPLECQFCGKFFSRMSNIQLHLKRHLGIRPYKCGVCAKFFITRQKMQEHETIHTGATPFQCGFCNEKFKRHSNLIQHRNRHHLLVKRKVKDFVCTTCGEVFHSSRKLVWHKETHDNKPKSCGYCSEKFIHASSLTRHIRRAHIETFVPQAERAKENVECPICKGVYLRSSLDTHIKSHSGLKNFACSVCDKEFTTKWNLKMHKWTHAGRAQKPFKCPQCSAAFIREAELTGHMNSHKSLRPYTCNHCGAQFIRKSNCQRHVKEHEQGKTFACNICGKTFHRSYYLNDHLRVHNGNRPFSCHICGKTSTTKSNHNKHVRIHHAREPVTTEN